ncbi:LuxR C-terminal-related transcriptional regulator [Cohnella suwonensis]|uniref:LuxR C-terminal-related transcriptional regulator n=1 Tax=Cohnella suwonensis TaxID=696072 RepID=A0ABW0LSP5_9BACL
MAQKSTEASPLNEALLSIVLTKISIPVQSGESQGRRRLEDQLDRYASHRLTTVTAPSGYGKTTLVANWARRGNRSVSWLSLDADDNDMMRFWHGIIASIQAVRSSFGESILQAMTSLPQYPIEACIAQITEQLYKLDVDFAIVLDDYHLIDNPAIHNKIAAWIDFLPPRIHLILISRSEPDFPVARLRARDQLLELNMNDLRFQHEETALYFKRQMHSSLSLSDIALLMQKTEGWIAGMKLMALSLNSHSDPSSFIDSINGSQRYIMDFLAEEVLLRQPEHVQSFLLQTSILDRMTGALCDRLTGQVDGNEVLLYLEKTNLFIVSLDQERRWYRYHHLFAEFLRDRLLRKDGERTRALYRQAADWQIENGYPTEAIASLLKAQSYAEAAELIGEAAPFLLKEGSWGLLNGWLSSFPQLRIYESERLSIAYAWSALLSGQSSEAEASLRKAGRTLTKTELWKQIPELQNDWLGEASIVRMMAAFFRKDIRGALTYAKESIQRKTTISDFIRIGIDFNVHEAFLTRGMLGMNGHLRKAASYIKQMEPDVEKDPENTQATGYSHVVFGEIMYEWDKLPQAEKYLLTGIKIGELSRNWGLLVPAYLTLVKVKIAQGKPNQAADLLQELIRPLSEASNDRWRSIADAYAITLQIQEGNLQAVSDWLENKGMTLQEGTFVVHEFEHTTKIRALRMIGRTAEALEHIERLLYSSEKEGRTLSQIELLNIQAMILYEQGQLGQATVTLHEGLLLAERDGYVRLYIDEGKPMKELLLLTLDRIVAGELRHASARYVRMLLEGFTERKGDRDGDQETYPNEDKETSYDLSPRQWEILKLVAAGETNQSIADQLFISIGTLKIHLNRIYKKLRVDNREQAVQWARREEPLR